jgi:hypothetical protein
MDDLPADLLRKIKLLNDAVWESKAHEPAVKDWLGNFSKDPADERLHALYVLSNFMYFGSALMRELMKVLYRDLFKYPIVAQIRKDNGDARDCHFIEARFQEELAATYFLGVGNPSESGCHLLYYFRQENGLPKTRFIHAHQIFLRDRSSGTTALRNAAAKRYVFIDDLCGSGKQGVMYSRDIVDQVKDLDSSVQLHYYVLFATSNGMSRLRNDTHFDRVECVFELDESFRCFSPSSRYFANPVDGISRDRAEEICRSYGDRLVPSHPLGYDDCQLLLGFHHNTPDNTLPIIWCDGNTEPWRPIFRRYPKVYL